MSFLKEMHRRSFLSTTLTSLGAVALSAVPTPAVEEATLPEGILPTDPLARYWLKNVSHLIDVKLPQELSLAAAQERHRIYALLLMALVVRFWNGNNNGPLGDYPFREDQKDTDPAVSQTCRRYRGDLNVSKDSGRISWDRYLGHNIACIAVDGKGEILDFDFNSNAIFRSSAEHAELRMVRRLFSLTDLIDDWKTERLMPQESKPVALKDVTIYTSLESCAQCSGVMSLARVKQVVYLQNDPGAYRIGNIVYNLAGNEPSDPDGDGSALAALPIPASAIGLPYFEHLNRSYEKFRDQQFEAKKLGDASHAYFVSCDHSRVEYTASISGITSFLCTDMALDIFRKGASAFESMNLIDSAYRTQPDSWSNQRCLDGAKRFFQYADVEGFRGSPHKL
jgi:tRNA(Arg) A34 adenosine deaminase TadA